MIVRSSVKRLFTESVFKAGDLYSVAALRFPLVTEAKLIMMVDFRSRRSLLEVVISLETDILW